MVNLELTLKYASTWAAMEELVSLGKVREIGEITYDDS